MSEGPQVQAEVSWGLRRPSGSGGGARTLPPTAEVQLDHNYKLLSLSISTAPQEGEHAPLHPAPHSTPASKALAMDLGAFPNESRLIPA